jgi:hypothetical protein
LLALYAALLVATAPRWPDGWDGVGFVESVRDFDLARFRPHPPGYPVYVALLRLADLLASTPLRACILVASASGAVAAAFAWDAVKRRAGEPAAWAVAVLISVAPGVWRVCSGVGSEATALACAAACGWGLAVGGSGSLGWRGPTVLGLGAGLGLGVRLSWAPLYVAALVLAPRLDQKRAWGTAAAACAAWAAPFAAIVGPVKLAALCAEHFGGHAAAWRAARWIGWRSASAVTVPYFVWIGLGQNLRDQPRHALPLVALLAAGLALPVGRSRRALGIVGALALAVSLRTAGDVRERRTIPPPGQQLVDLVRAQPSPARPAVFGVASVRFFEMTELASSATAVASLGEARMHLTRANELPTRVWVTSELAGLDDSRWPLALVANLCRPVRLERAAPCLGVYEWKVGGR